MTETDGYPWVIPSEMFERFVDSKVMAWGATTPLTSSRRHAPRTPNSDVGGPAFERRTTSPGAYRSLMDMNAETDVREVLPSIPGSHARAAPG